MLSIIVTTTYGPNPPSRGVTRERSNYWAYLTDIASGGNSQHDIGSIHQDRCVA